MSGQGPSKRKAHSHKYNHHTKRSRLAFAAGSSGILVTCHSLHERNGATEALNILEETFDKLGNDGAGGGAGAGPPAAPAGGAAGGGAKKPDSRPLTVAEELALEAAEMKTGKKKQKSRFSSMPTGCRGILMFLLPRTGAAAVAQTTTTTPGALVKAMVAEIQRDVHDQRQSKSRHCERMVPLEVICTAKLDEVVAAATTLFEKFLGAHPHFKRDGLKFAIRIKIRHNDSLKRSEVIDGVAKLFAPPHSVDLTQPDVLFVIEGVRSVCGLSIVLASTLRSSKFSIKCHADDDSGGDAVLGGAAAAASGGGGGGGAAKKTKKKKQNKSSALKAAENVKGKGEPQQRAAGDATDDASSPQQPRGVRRK